MVQGDDSAEPFLALEQPADWEPLMKVYIGGSGVIVCSQVLMRVDEQEVGLDESARVHIRSTAFLSCCCVGAGGGEATGIRVGTANRGLAAADARDARRRQEQGTACSFGHW